MPKNSLFFAFYGYFHELLPSVLGFQGDLDVSNLWPKTRLFSVLLPFSRVIAHSFGVPRKVACLRGMDQKFVVFAFYDCFHDILPTVLGFLGRFTFFRGMTKKSKFFLFMAVFMSYCP